MTGAGELLLTSPYRVSRNILHHYKCMLLEIKTTPDLEHHGVSAVPFNRFSFKFRILYSA